MPVLSRTGFFHEVVAHTHEGKTRQLRDAGPSLAEPVEGAHGVARGPLERGGRLLRIDVNPIDLALCVKELADPRVEPE